MPKILGESLEQHRETTRDRVFEALVALLAHQSFGSITMADLAAEAGIGRSALYNHFRDKEDVVVDFAAMETQRYLAALEQALARVTGPRERLATYVTHHVESSTHFHVGLGTELAAALSPASLLRMREHAVAVEEVLRDILGAGQAAGEFRDADVGALTSLVHATLQAKRASAQDACDFVLAGVSRHTTRDVAAT